MIAKHSNTNAPSFEEEGFFEKFFEHHFANLCFFANRFVKDPTISEDIVSESLVKVWQKRNGLLEPSALKNYCYTTVRNACLRWLQNQSRASIAGDLHPDALFTEETALQNIIRAEVVEQVHAAIRALPPRSSQVFSKLYIEGKTVAEAAKELQVTISTVKSHKRTGLALLRGMITRVIAIST